MNSIFWKQRALHASLRLCLTLGCVLMTVSLTGCFELHRGYYRALKPDAEWRLSREEGGNFFWYPTKNVPDWYIQMRGDELGKAYVGIGSRAYDPWKIWKVLKFPDHTSIRVLFNDKHTEVTIDSDRFLSTYGQKFFTEYSRDFTIILPSFEIGENKIPPLTAHLQWTDGTYVEWVPIQ